MRIIKSITVVIMSLFYIGVGVMHFINPKPFLIIIPDYFPNDVHLLLVYVSGFFEIILGFFLLIENTIDVWNFDNGRNAKGPCLVKICKALLLLTVS